MRRKHIWIRDERGHCSRRLWRQQTKANCEDEAKDSSLPPEHFLLCPEANGLHRRAIKMSEKAFKICAPLVLRAVLLRGPQGTASFLQPSLVVGMGEGSSLACLEQG